MEPPLPTTPSRDPKGPADSVAPSPSLPDDHIETSPEHETVATVPLQNQNQTQPTQVLTPTQRLTQPTQIIERPTPDKTSNTKPSTVEVFASSPLSSTPGTSRSINPRSGLSSAMAPAGTRFCPPPVAKKREPVIDLCDTDDEPAYRGGSSDDDLQCIRSTDIKPAKFGKSNNNTAQEKVSESPVGKGGINRFKEITASAMYNPSEKNNTGKRPSSEEVSGQKSAKKLCQSAPSRAQTLDLDVEKDLTLDDIYDYQTKVKVQRMRAVFPQQPVTRCLSIILGNDGNYEKALAELAAYDEKEKAAQSSEDELSTTKPTTAPAKQHIKARSRIQDKYAASQGFASQKRQHSPEPATKPRKRLMRGTRNPQPESSGQSSPPQKKLSNLVRGGKIRSQSHSESPEPIAINSDSDSELSAESEADEKLPEKVLKFFNTCTALELVDIAATTEAIANKILAHRPFRNLTAIRKVTDEDPAKPTNGKRKTTKKAIGDKVVEKCLDMWTGYEAVDSLVAECENLGKPIAEKMKQWGVDIFGVQKEGELDIVSLGASGTSDKPNTSTSGNSDSQPTHDSGIGTPESQRSSDDDGEKPNGAVQKNKTKFLPQPSVMSESIKMKDYQIVGLNWLALLYEQGLSCILADDMGLGKTCQVISFLSHLYEKGENGPHLVVVPSSTLENWLREFSIFCPKLKVMPYYAGQSARAEIREQILDEKDEINVVITTYTIAKAKVDAAFLRSVKFNVCVYDEGHMLKSSKSMLYEKLIRISAKCRLLLTGTPLQNNLQELASLLGFIMPEVFKDRKEDLEYVFSHKAKTVGDGGHAALLSAQRIARAKSMMAPFVLRRKKHQVIELPAKVAHVEYCEMETSQQEIYKNEQELVRQLSEARATGKKAGTKTANILMKLRQAAIHPLLYRRIYDEKALSRISKACVTDEKWALSDPDVVYTELLQYSDFEVHSLCTANPKSIGKFALKDDEWMDSGKVSKLCELLKRFQENGDRTLIFSQFTMVMDILELVLETIKMRFFRLDGRTSVEDRQSILDAFHEQEDIPVFLLSTKAGGAGINLACANKVIIFDSSFNPQEDVQAENRAHRVGQTREVEVIRLVTKETIEDQIYALGQTKLVLDQRVAGEECTSAAEAKKDEDERLKTIEEMVIAKFESSQKKDEKATST